MGAENNLEIIDEDTNQQGLDSTDSRQTDLDSENNLTSQNLLKEQGTHYRS